LFAGINKRFGHLFNDTAFLLAAASLPKFKLYWVDDAELKLRSSLLLLTAVQKEQNSTSQAVSTSTSTLNTTNDSGTWLL